jgi:hypothetical protein
MISMRILTTKEDFAPSPLIDQLSLYQRPFEHFSRRLRPAGFGASRPHLNFSSISHLKKGTNSLKNCKKYGHEGIARIL